MSDGNYIAAERCLNQIEDERLYFSLFTNWMRACYMNNIVKVNEYMSEFSKLSRENQKAFLVYGINILRECFLVHYGSSNIQRLDDEEQVFVKKFSVFVTPDNIGAFSKAFNDAVSHVERNANANILFVDVSLKVHHFIKMVAAPQAGVKK
jgi:DNA polymerase-3 subunit delta'